MTTLYIHFTPDLRKADRDSLKRLLAPDAAYDRGDMLENEEHIYFESMEKL